MTYFNHYNYLFYDTMREEYIYTGMGTKIRKRITRPQLHLKRKDKHPFTQRLQLMKRNSVKPVITIVEAASLNAALAIERFWEKTIGCKHDGTGTLLNLKPCGEKGGAGPRPQAVKDKISNALLKRGTEFYEKFAETHKKAMQESNSLQVTCPHCNKTGGRSPMHRWHFDNCRTR